LFGLHASDRRVRHFLDARGAKTPELEPGVGTCSVDMKKLGTKLQFWVGYPSDRIPDPFRELPYGTLVQAEFFQEGIEKHRAFGGTLPGGLRVDMTRSELIRAFGAPTDACTCGKKPVCYVQWLLSHFDDALEAVVTHHERHAGRTGVRPG